MKCNAKMLDILRSVDLTGMSEKDVPFPFQGILREGWCTTENGARVLRTLWQGYNGRISEFSDIVHFEVFINGRGMTDYDLPEQESERIPPLLRRSVAYACAGLRNSQRDSEVQMKSYISLSLGGLDDRTLTAHVTFCGEHAGVPPYIDDVHAFQSEALMEVSPGDCESLGFV